MNNDRIHWSRRGRRASATTCAAMTCRPCRVSCANARPPARGSIRRGRGSRRIRGDTVRCREGGDPRPGSVPRPGQAHGLCSRCPPGVPVPPSLDNMFARSSAYRHPRPDHGCLRRGTTRRVAAQRGAHGRGRPPRRAPGKGWEGFTDHVVETLDREREGLVFLLWGSYAQAKGRVIDPRRHRVLKTTHPSPLSAHRGFLGCGHFSAANEYLMRRGEAPIDWSLPARAELAAP